MGSPATRTRLHTCMLCEAACGLAVDLEGEQVVRVRGDSDDPFSRGHVCPKAAAIPDVMSDPDRVREPLRRSGSGWTPVSWKEALGEAGTRLAEIQRRHGRHSVALYLGNPTIHGYGATLGAALLSRALGSRSRFSATSVDQLPQMLAALEMFGHALLVPVPDVDRTAYLLVLGANPLVSNGSLMTAPGIATRLEQLRARGGRVVVVDPRRSETARFADRHVPILPGGDAPLLLGLLHVIFSEGLARPGRLADFTVGLDRLEAIARRFPPERVAGRAGVQADLIRELAREFAAAPSAVCYGRVGISTQAFGGLASWLVLALNLVTGNLDRAGGAMFTTPAADLVGLLDRLGSRGGFDRYRTRVRGLPEFGGELPAATLAEEIETEGEGRIRALVTFAGNPVLSTPNGGRLDRALARLDYMVSIDLYRNETTRRAHLLLPVAFGFEREHYDLALYSFAVRNVARHVPALVDPPSGVRGDWEVLTDVAAELRRRGGGNRRTSVGVALGVARALGPRRLLDLLLRLGPHGLSLAALARRPHGVDLGPLEVRLPGRLFTPGHLIRLVPDRFERDLGRLERALDEPVPPAGSLLLIGRRQLRGNNSWMHNSARLVKGAAACTLLMHPQDAEARGLENGDEVLVTSRVGAVRVPISVTHEMARGVVSLPHGWGHGRPDGALGVAGAHAGASVNDLTDDARVDDLCGTADFAVEVTVDSPPESAGGRRRGG